MMFFYCADDDERTTLTRMLPIQVSNGRLIFEIRMSLASDEK